MKLFGTKYLFQDSSNILQVHFQMNWHVNTVYIHFILYTLVQLRLDAIIEHSSIGPFFRLIERRFRKSNIYLPKYVI